LGRRHRRGRLVLPLRHWGGGRARGGLTRSLIRRMLGRLLGPLCRRLCHGRLMHLLIGLLGRRRPWGSLLLMDLRTNSVGLV